MNKSTKRLLLALLIIVLSIAGGTALYSWYNQSNNSSGSNTSSTSSSKSSTEEVKVVQAAATTFTPSTIQLQTGDVATIPDTMKFMTQSGNTLALNPGKYDIGDYEFTVTASDKTKTTYKLKVSAAPVDMDKLNADLTKLIGTSRAPHYGIYIYDPLRNQTLKINEGKDMPPASISKLPSVILALRDVDAGKYTLDTKFPVKNSLKHTYVDSIGVYPEGTMLPLRQYLTAAIHESNNTAHYHIHDEVLGGMENVVPRTDSELKARIYLNPHVATADGIATLLKGIYSKTYLSESSTAFILDLMEHTLSSLRTGIPAGIPANSNIKVADKVGFLFGGKEGDVYSDASIVYGLHTDYILVVLNDQAPPYPQGAQIIKQISQLVYSYMDK
jgi:beta-lactamase class A